MEEAEAHLLPAADVLRRFSVTAEGGLSPEQVTGARERYGPNGESAGHAGAAGAACAAVSVSPPAPRLRRGPLPSQPSAPAGGRAGRKRGLRKPLQMPLGLPAGLRGTFAGEVGVRVPGSETGRLAPLPRSPPSGPRDACGPSGLTTSTRVPVHSCRPSPTPIGAQRCIPAPPQSAGVVQVHTPGSAGEGPAGDSEAQPPS